MQIQKIRIHKIIRESLPYYFIIASVLIISIFIQLNLFLNWDVILELNYAKNVLGGADYVTHFFNISPPSIFYIYFPVIWISKLLNINLIIIVRIFTYLCGIISLIISGSILKKIQLDKNENLSALVLISICYFLLPSYEFGQREHIMVMFSMPYVLSVAARKMDLNLPGKSALLIGIFAGIGLIIKPIFLLLPILLELYLLCSKRKWKVLLSNEVIGIVLVHVLYTALALYINPNYIYKMLPLLFQYDIKNFMSSYEALFKSDSSIVFWIGVLIFIFHRLSKGKNRNIETLIVVSILSATAFYIAFMITRRLWWYHEIPTIIFVMLMSLFILANSWPKNISVRFIVVLIVTIGLMCYPMITAYQHTKHRIITYLSPDSLQNKLIQITKDHAKNSYIIVMDPRISIMELTAFYGQAKLSRAFDLSNIVIPFMANGGHVLQKDRDNAIRFMVQSIQKEKPKLIFVNEMPVKPYAKYPFDYISFYSGSDEFKHEFKHYKKIKTVVNFGIYLRE